MGFVNPDSGDLPYPATEDAEKLQSILTHLADAKEPKGSQPAVPEHGLKGHKASPGAGWSSGCVANLSGTQ